MKKSRLSKVRMVKLLHEADARVAKKHSAADAWRLRQLEQENARLKTLVAERDFEIEVIREISRRKC